MAPRTRRSLLALLTGAATPLAGCQTTPGGSAPTRPTTSSTDVPRGGLATSPTATEPPPTADTETTPGRTLVLTAAALSPGTVATVYPPSLRSLLREAATTDGPVRARAGTPVYAPEPLVPTLDRVRLASPDGAVDGVYDVAAEGGPYYEWRVGATAATDVPEDAAVTPVGDLAPDRRAFAERALEPGGTLVSPETALGSWVRHEFLGGYVSRDGAVYRGRKLLQTDAAFFSREVWYVLALRPVGGSGTPVRETGTPTGTTESPVVERRTPTPTVAPESPPTLRLRAVPDPVGRVVGGMVGTYHRDRVTADLSEDGVDGDAVARFARETGGLAFHAANYDVEVVEDGYP